MGIFKGPFVSEQERENNTIKKLLEDFPWLWAIKPHWSSWDLRTIKISQEMADLKMVLSKQSKETAVTLWSFSSQPCDIFNGHMKSFWSAENKTWAQIMMEETPLMFSVKYIFVVNRRDEVTIFRHPQKHAWNSFIEDVNQLLGTNAHWLIGPEL